MDDQSFDEWTSALSGLRNIRLSDIKRRLQEKGGSFTPAEFYVIARQNMEAILDKWVEIEERSRKTSPPPDLKEALNESKQEFESVVEFEAEAIDRDVLMAREGASWLESDLDAEKKKFEKALPDLKAKRLLKLTRMSDPGKKEDDKVEGKNDRAEKSKVKIRRPTSGASSSGAGVFSMFLLGLILGGGPAFYFYDVFKKKTAAYEEESQVVRTEKRNVEDELVLVRGAFSSLAEGKIRNIPQLRRLIDPIREKAKQDAANANRYFLSRREKILKSIPSGDRQDRALANLEEEKERKLQSIKAAEEKRLKPLLDELQTLREMMGE